MDTAQFLSALVAVVAAGVAPTIVLSVYLGSRIDRLSERVSDLSERLARVEQRLDDHAATHASLAHGRS
jgi:hypothetical protein